MSQTAKCCRCGKEEPRYPIRMDPAKCVVQCGEKTWTHTICETCWPAFRTSLERAALESDEEMECVGGDIL